MRRFDIWLASILMLAAVSGARADTSLFGAAGLDSSFCKQSNSRQTVVYIDDMMMVDGKQGWAPKLANKLQATLAPGERVTVVRLSPRNGQSNEIWSGCWPEYSAQERARLEKQTYFFSRSPLADLSEQKKFFMRDLNGALAAIYGASRRPVSVARIDPQRPPEKNIIRALAFDEARFAQSRTTIRAIIYSDLAENSDLGSIFKPSGTEEDYGKKLGTYLRQSVIYAYGMDEDVAGSASLLEETRKFWTDALRSMNASVGGLGTDLNVQNAIPTSARTYVVDLNRDGQDLEGRLSLLTDSDGNLVDSWLQIMRLSVAGLSGTFRCDGPSESQNCRLSAKTTGGLVTQNSEEDVLLSGTDRAGMTGQIGVKGALMYPLKAVKPEN